jgi:Protein of unknown function (DUF2855)
VEFLVNRDDLHECKVVESEAPGIEEGQALLAVDSFGVTANNITYAVMGDAMSYWRFFPSREDGWGHVPMWGFAEVADANGTGLQDGARLYGYLPPCTYLAVQPGGVSDRGFRDNSPHRAELPSAYQGYRLTDADPLFEPSREAEQMLFWPLFFTSWLIDDQIADEDFYGAESIVISSASSKTAIIAAFELAQRDDAPRLVGLTSAGNRDFVQGLGIYDGVVTYDAIGELPGGKAAYVDMSGDGEVRWEVHERYGDDLTHDMPVGMSHHEQLAAGRHGKLKGPKPEFFFAPVRAKKRISDWSGRELDDRMAAAWKPFVEWCGGWLEVRRGEGPDALKDTYLEVLDGKVPPKAGHVVSL